MRYLAKFIVGLLCFGILGQAGFADVTFTDIDASTYKESIISLAKKGIVQGYENALFKPLQPVNRAELLKIVFKALDQNADGHAGNCFSDVVDQWYAPYVCKAKELAIVQGYADGFYRPGQMVNMVEALKIVLEAFDLPLDAVKGGEAWFAPYVEFAHRNNIFSKYAYQPGRAARREEMAFLVDDMLKILKEEKTLAVNRDIRSPGCGLTMLPASVPTKFAVNGVERSAITVVPASYKPGTPISLVFAFHGRTNSNQMVRSYYGLEAPSKGQAIIVYPAGMPNAGGYSWADPGDSAGNLRDYKFFDVMLEQFNTLYCVNVDQVYVVGHSLGAWFSNSLACARGDKIRAVASLGGSISSSECKGPVAVMQWHNPKDQQAPFSEAVAARDFFLGQNQCSKESKSVEPLWGNCVQYQGCMADASVIFCPHTKDLDYRGDFYPHNWPKGTGEEMWKFFQSLNS